MTTGTSKNDGKQPVERVVDGGGIAQHQRALREIIENQGREDEREPGELDRLAAEVPQIGIERFATGYRQEHKPERHEADEPMLGQKANRKDRVCRGEHMRIVGEMRDTDDAEGEEPDHHHRSEPRCDTRGPMRLHGE